MRTRAITRKLSFSIAACAVIFAATGIASFSSASVASARTAGIISANLELNLDPNISDSYSGTGTTVNDLSGNNRDGTLEGNSLPVFRSASPKSFEFTREYVGGTNSPDNRISVSGTFLSDDFTVQTWIKTNQVGYDWAHYTTMYIVASECGGGADDWGFGVDNQGKLAFGVGPSDATFSTPENVDINDWVNVAATREKSTGEINLYINGDLKATGIGNAGNTVNCSSDGNTWIGNGQDAPAYTFGGKIGSVLGYSRALTPAQILTNYNATVNTFHPVTYTISYSANGATSGTVPTNSSFTSGGAATPIASNSGSLARSGYTFAGWNTADDGTGTTYEAGNSTYSANANVVLYAKWIAIAATTTTTTVAPAAVINIEATSRTTSKSKSSSASTTQTTVAPVTDSVPTASATSPSTSIAPPSIPKVAAGESALDVGGVTRDLEVVRENNQLVLKSGSLEAQLSGQDKNGTQRPLDGDGNLHLVSGDVVKLNLGGFKPDSKVDVWLFSTPQLLGSAQVEWNGKMAGSFVIPEGIEQGDHRLAVRAIMADGTPATITIGIVIGALNRTSTVARVLIAIPIVIAVGFGIILPTQLRRRRKGNLS